VDVGLLMIRFPVRPRRAPRWGRPRRFGRRAADEDRLDRWHHRPGPRVRAGRKLLAELGGARTSLHRESPRRQSRGSQPTAQKGAPPEGPGVAKHAAITQIGGVEERG
jgi:hypothetical protein